MSTKKPQSPKKRRRLDRDVWATSISPERSLARDEVDPWHPDAIIARDAPSPGWAGNDVPFGSHLTGDEDVRRRRGTRSPSLKSVPEIPESPQASRSRTQAEQNASSARARRLGSPVRIVTPGRRAYSEELPGRPSLHTPLDTRDNPENLSHSGIRRNLLSGRKNNMLTPHGRAAHRTLDLRRAAIFTPNQSRRRSVQEQRETPHGWLSELSRALAPKSKRIELSPVEDAADDVELVQRPRRHVHDDDDDDLPIRPRLSMNLDLDDPDLRPHTSHGLEDQNYTAHSIEMPRRAISEQPPGDLTELGYRTNEFVDDRSDDISVDLSFFPRRPLDEFDAASYGGDETLIRESPQRQALGRISDFGLQVPLDLDQSTFIMDAGGDDAGGDGDLTDRAVGRDGDDDQELDNAGEAYNMEDGFGDDNDIELAPLGTSFPRTPSPDLEAPSRKLSINGRMVLRSAEVTPEQPNIGRRRTQNMGWEEDNADPDEVSVVPSNLPEQPKPQRKKNVKGSKRGNQFDALPETHVKKVSQGILRSLNFKPTITKPTMKALMRATNWFFKQMSEDLGAYAKHAGRDTITEADVALLMKRQGHINDTTTLFSLAQKHLPREMVQLLRVPPDPMLKDPPKRKAGEYEEEEERPPPPRHNRQTTLKNPPKRMMYEDDEDDDDDDDEGGEEVEEHSLPPRRRQSISRKPPKRKAVDVDENDEESEEHSPPHRHGKPTSGKALKRKRVLNNESGVDGIPVSVPAGSRSRSRRTR